MTNDGREDTEKFLLELTKKIIYDELLKPYFENYMGYMFSSLSNILSEKELLNTEVSLERRKLELLNHLEETAGTLQLDHIQGNDKELYYALSWWMSGATESFTRMAEMMVKASNRD